ncbi:hypothetical protein GYMLUDRAFT_128037, partial [Collybiopsis luxurians FD-317 M1]
DGHNSHLTPETLEFAKDHNVIVFCLPPHTTHRVQPCNVSAFAPLKHHWQALLRDYYNTHGYFLPASDVVHVYMEARKLGFKPETIKKACCKSGIDMMDP